MINKNLFLANCYLFGIIHHDVVHSLPPLPMFFINVIFFLLKFKYQYKNMTEKTYEEVKESVLAHMQGLFEEMEEDMAMSHQEKYALLEDMFENASDADELRVAFEQWYVDHAEDLGLEHDADELWDQAL
jgi:hypothetical protein